MRHYFFVFFCIFLVTALTDCNCDDQLGSVLGEVELSLCDRGDRCGCHTLTGDGDIIDFGTVADGMSARRILRIENANQPQKLVIRGLRIEDAAGVFNIGTITKFSALPGESDSIEVSTHDFAEGDLVLLGSEYAEVFVDFTASTQSEFSGTMSVLSNSRTREEWTIELRAGAGSSEICLPNGDCSNNSSLDFGTFNDNEVGPDLADPLGRPLALGTENISVTNTGSGEVLVTVELTNDGIPETLPGELVGSNGVFFLGATDCLVIGPGETLDVPVQYRPSTAGEHNGEIVIAGLGAPVTIPLSGRVIGPHICFRTDDDQPLDARLQFGNAPSYSTAQNVIETRKIWARNCGYQADLEIDSVNAATDSSGEFSSEALPWSPRTLGVGEEIELEVSYAPNIANALGSTSTGRYLFETNDTFRPISAVDLIARIGQPEQCILVPSPSPVDFGWVAQDEADVGDDCDSLPIALPGCEELISRVMELTFTNVGQRPCTDITLASIITDSNSTDMFEYHDATGIPPAFNLDAGQSSSPIKLLFKRTPVEIPGNHFANLPYTYAEMSVPQQVLLKSRAGGSPDCAVSFQPTTPPTLFCNEDSLNFGNVNIGQEKTIELKVVNSGSAECNVTNIQRSLTTAGVFSFSSTDLPGTIPVNEFRTIQVHFQPVPPSGNNPFEELPFLCAINQLDFTVNSGAGGSMQTESVALAGKGTRPDIDVIPGQIDFGLVTVGCCSQWERVAIYNSGDGTLQINTLSILGTSDPGFETTQPGTMALPPGSSTEFEVRYCADAVGDFTGVVEIQSTDDNEEIFSVPMTAEGTLDSSGYDEFQQPQRPLVDVLFSVDDSGSMSEEQSNLASNFSSFINSASSLDTDYHIGVVTTDSESEQRGQLYACSGNPLWISDDQPVTTQRAQFDCNVRVSDSGRPSSDSKESPLQAARLALDYPNLDGFNAGFYREDAKLYVILVTDEEDQSDGTAQLYVDYFRNLKGVGNPDLLNISAIAGPPPNGCDTAEANQVDYDAVNMVGGQFRSICSADWANMVSSLGLDVFNARRQFPLSRPATPGTISVEVCDADSNNNPINCQTVMMDPTNGWTFDVNLNAITFHGIAIPGPSEIIKIDYESICFE